MASLLLIRDVAEVQFGSPPRYGAMTYNGEKEVVGGIVLMTERCEQRSGCCNCKRANANRAKIVTG